MLTVADQPVLQHFGIAAEQVFTVECAEKTGVDDDGIGFAEHTDFVFQTTEVDTRLSAD